MLYSTHVAKVDGAERKPAGLCRAGVTMEKDFIVWSDAVAAIDICQTVISLSTSISSSAPILSELSACQSAPVWAVSCTIKRHANPALPFPVVTGGAATRPERGEERGCSGESTTERVLEFLSGWGQGGVGGQHALPSEKIYLKEYDSSLSDC